MEQAKKTAAYRVVADSGGSMVFRFYCDISACCDVAIEVRRRLPNCRVYLICEDGYPKKQAALEKAVELKLIDGHCIGDLSARQMRTWLDETAETMPGGSAR